jgi:lipopolysaccharide export system permease protein
VFEGVRQSEFHEGGVVARSLERWEWHSDLAPDLIDVAVVSPERLSAWDLAKYSAFLRDNGQDAAPYELALWGKLMLPASTAVMVFLALPFVMGPLRSAGTGQRVLVGALAGIAFHILSRLFADAAVVYGFSPIVGAAAPTALFLGIGIGLAARLR